MKRIFILLLISIYAHQTICLDILKSYLYDLKSSIIIFEQITDKSKNEGAVLISKNNHFRVNYFTNANILITGNSNIVSLYDYELQQLYNLSRGDEKINMLIFDEHNINKLSILQMIKKQDHIEYLVKLGEQEASLIFTAQPYKLDQILIKSMQGEIFDIKIKEILKVSQYNKNLFHIKNPKIFGAPKILNKKDLYNKITLLN